MSIRLVTPKGAVRHEFNLPAEPTGDCKPVIAKITAELTKNTRLCIELDDDVDPSVAFAIGAVIANYRPTIYHRPSGSTWVFGP